MGKERIKNIEQMRKQIEEFGGKDQERESVMKRLLNEAEKINKNIDNMKDHNKKLSIERKSKSGDEKQKIKNDIQINKFQIRESKDMIRRLKQDVNHLGKGGNVIQDDIISAIEEFHKVYKEVKETFRRIHFDKHKIDEGEYRAYYNALEEMNEELNNIEHNMNRRKEKSIYQYIDINADKVYSAQRKIDAVNMVIKHIEQGNGEYAENKLNLCTKYLNAEDFIGNKLDENQKLYLEGNLEKSSRNLMRNQLKTIQKGLSDMLVQGLRGENDINKIIKTMQVAINYMTNNKINEAELMLMNHAIRRDSLSDMTLADNASVISNDYASSINSDRTLFSSNDSISSKSFKSIPNNKRGRDMD